MKNLNFYNRVKITAAMSIISNMCPLVGIALSLILKNKVILIVSVLLYLILKILDKFVWRCPKCNSKLPKGSIDNVKYCSNCNFELSIKSHQ